MESLSRCLSIFDQITKILHEHDDLASTVYFINQGIASHPQAYKYV
jgi:hypothetical protein